MCQFIWGINFCGELYLWKFPSSLFTIGRLASFSASLRISSVNWTIYQVVRVVLVLDVYAKHILIFLRFWLVEWQLLVRYIF